MRAPDPYSEMGVAYWRERALAAERRGLLNDPLQKYANLYQQTCRGCGQTFYHECPGVDVKEQLFRLEELQK